MFGLTGEKSRMFEKTGVKHPMFEKPRPEGAGRPYQKIEAIDIKKNHITTRYDSISLAALAISTISNFSIFD